MNSEILRWTGSAANRSFDMRNDERINSSDGVYGLREGRYIPDKGNVASGEVSKRILSDYNTRFVDLSRRRSCFDFQFWLQVNDGVPQGGSA